MTTDQHHHSRFNGHTAHMKWFGGMLGITVGIIAIATFVANNSAKFVTVKNQVDANKAVLDKLEERQRQDAKEFREQMAATQEKNEFRLRNLERRLPSK